MHEVTEWSEVNGLCLNFYFIILEILPLLSYNLGFVFRGKTRTPEYSDVGTSFGTDSQIMLWVSTTTIGDNV